MSTTLSLGNISLPGACETEVRGTIVIPSSEPKLPTSGKVVPTPSINLVWSRHAQPQSATEALETLLQAALSKSFSLLGQEELTFDDKAAGVSGLLEVEAAPNVVLRQRHVVRTDEGVVTHFVLTGPAASFSRTDEEWLPRILGFKL